jgi:hypothetical protein
MNFVQQHLTVVVHLTADLDIGYLCVSGTERAERSHCYRRHVERDSTGITTRLCESRRGDIHVFFCGAHGLHFPGL